MKKNILFVSVSLFVFASSCTVLKTNTTKTMDIYGAGVIQNPVIVDLDVLEEKITGIATEDSDEPLEVVKQNAVVDALKKANADVLVEPSFETITSNGKTKATVVGFPAKYKNFRPIKTEDIHLLQIGVSQKAEVYEAPKNRRKWKVPSLDGSN